MEFKGAGAAAAMAGAAASEYDMSVTVAAKCVEKLSNDDTKKASLEPLDYTQQAVYTNTEKYGPSLESDSRCVQVDR